jgi:hypothetical protein
MHRLNTQHRLLADILSRVDNLLVEQELLTLQEHLSSTHLFNGVRVAESAVFSVVFYQPLFVLFSLLLWPMYYLFFFFELRLLNTHLVSLNFLFFLF